MYLLDTNIALLIKMFYQHVIWNLHVPEYGFSLTCIFPYKDRIYNSVLIREWTSQTKPLLWHILRSVKSSFHEELKSLRYNLGLVIEAVIRWTSTGELAELALDSLEKMRLFRELIYLI